jgi:hypothetical protein
MVKEPVPVDIGDRPELLRLAEEVRSGRTPRLLTHGDREVAILMPVEPGSAIRKGSVRRDRRTGPQDPLWNIIGLGAQIEPDQGPTNVADGKYKYLANATSFAVMDRPGIG